MKKKSLLIGFLALSLFFSFGFGVYAAPKLSVWFNGKSNNVSVKIIDKKAYVPLNDVVSWFGGKVTFDKKTNSYKVTSKDYDPTPPKSYSVNVTSSTGPMKLTISKVTINPNYKPDPYSSAFKAVILDVKVQNTSTNKVNWYPTQGIYAFNTGEQIEDAIVFSELVDGTFLGKTTKSGKIVLKVNSSKLDSIKSMQIYIDAPVNDNYDSVGKDVLFNLKFR